MKLIKAGPSPGSIVLVSVGFHFDAREKIRGEHEIKSTNYGAC